MDPSVIFEEKHVRGIGRIDQRQIHTRIMRNSNRPRRRFILFVRYVYLLNKVIFRNLHPLFIRFTTLYLSLDEADQLRGDTDWDIEPIEGVLQPRILVGSVSDEGDAGDVALGVDGSLCLVDGLAALDEDVGFLGG